MITLRELREAIADVEGKESPNLKTCYTLAALYIIQDHMTKPDNAVSYYGESEFCRAIQGKDTAHILEIMDALMTKLQAVNPKLYDETMRNISPGE